MGQQQAAGNRPADPRWPSAADWLGRRTGGPVDVALLGVPAAARSLSRTGAHATPAAVRRALRRLSTWSGPAGIDLATLAGRDLGDVPDPDDAGLGEQRTREAAAAAAAETRLLVAVGGDNSVTAPTCRGACDRGWASAGLVTLDAHHDVRQGRTNGSPVRVLVEEEGLDPHRIAQVGIAGWANSRSYAEQAHGWGITVLDRMAVSERGVASCVGEALTVAGSAGGPVYVDLDLDVCDRSVAPACPASLPGGLSAAELLTAALLVGRDPRVRAVDLTEVDATADGDGRTVRLAALCLLQVAAGLALRDAGGGRVADQ